MYQPSRPPGAVQALLVQLREHFARDVIDLLGRRALAIGRLQQRLRNAAVGVVST